MDDADLALTAGAGGHKHILVVFGGVAGIEDVVANDADWPSVEWPHYEGSQTGEGDKGDYHIGVGGYCQDDLQVKNILRIPTRGYCALRCPCVCPGCAVLAPCTYCCLK